jgi:uncharacterized protein YceK
VRLATFLVIVALLAVLAGCGSSDKTTGTAPTKAPNETAQVRAAWEQNPACQRPPGASRWGCSVGPYRCQGVVSDRGWAISCSRPGRSLAFTVRP